MSRIRPYLPFLFVVLATLIGPHLAWAAPTVADAHDMACSGGTTWLDAILQAVVPWTPVIIVVGIIAVVFEMRQGQSSFFAHAVSHLGQTGMTVVLAASAGTFGALTAVAANLPACK